MFRWLTTLMCIMLALVALPCWAQDAPTLRGQTTATLAKAPLKEPHTDKASGPRPDATTEKPTSQAKATELGQRILKAHSLAVDQTPAQDAVDILFFRKTGELDAALAVLGSHPKTRPLWNSYVESLGKPLDDDTIATLRDGLASKNLGVEYVAELLLSAVYLQRGEVLLGLAHAQASLSITADPDFMPISLRSEEAQFNALSLLATGFILDNNLTQAHMAIERQLDLVEMHLIRLDSFSLLHNLSVAYELQNRADIALKITRLMSQMKGATPYQKRIANYGLGRLLIKNDESPSGVDMLLNVMKGEVDNRMRIGALLALAQGYSQMSEPNAAQDYIQLLEAENANLDPQKTAVLYGIKADIALQLGQHEQAAGFRQTQMDADVGRLTAALSKNRRDVALAASVSERVNAEKLERQEDRLRFSETILMFTVLISVALLAAFLLMLLLYRRIRHKNAELSEARNAAVLGERAKTEFLAMMSHEIRTPLNSIIPLADHLFQKSRDLAERKILHTIAKSGRDLLDQVENIFSLTSGDELLNDDERPVDIKAMLRKVNARLSELNDKNVELVYRKGSELSGAYFMDEKKVSQILLCLVSNAVKFSHAYGKVEVNITNGTDGQLSFRIQDHGVGFNTDDLSAIMEPFQQGDNSIKRHYGGSGLGLAVANRLTKLLGGTLTIRSALGAGTIAVVSIPAQKQTVAIAA